MRIINTDHNTILKMARDFVHLAYYNGIEPSKFIQTTSKYRRLVQYEYEKAKELAILNNIACQNQAC